MSGRLARIQHGYARSMSSSSHSGWLVLANSDAGSAARAELGAALSVLAADAPTVVVHTDDPQDSVDALLAHEDLSAVIFGGDGTVSATVERLVHADMGHRALGLVPGGTGNDLARALGLPLDPADAARALLDSVARPQSVLRVGPDRIGVNVCHVGVGAAASRRAASWKQRLGPLAYPLGAAMEGLRRGPWPMSVSVDGAVLGRPPLLMVAVVLGRTIGGGTELSSDADLDSRDADVMAVPGGSLAARRRLATALLRGDARSGSGVHSTRGAEVVIESDQQAPVNLDGEDLGERARLDISIEPRAWTVLAPQRGSRA